MKKLFLLGIMLALGSSVCAMENKLGGSEELYKAFLKTLNRDDKAFLFDKGNQGEEAFKERSPFWLLKGGPRLDEEYIKKIVEKISSEKVEWEAVVYHMSHIGDGLTALVYFTFRKGSKKENIKKNQKDLLCLADALQVCIDRYDGLEKQLKRDLIANMFVVPRKTSPLSKRIELVRKFYK